MRLLRTFAADPVAVGRALPGELLQWRQRGERHLYEQADEGWNERLHTLLGAPWPCSLAGELESLMSEIGKQLADAGLQSGRFTYAYYSDAEVSLCSAVWCVVAHTRPEIVVETGVAHGVTSRVILEGLARNGTGHLWSIDLPFPFDQRLHARTGVAVTGDCRERWSYVEGASRQRMPSLVKDVGHVDFFVHDSLHTARNTIFELEQAASSMPRGGVLLADDIGSHNGFEEFAARHSEYETIVCPAADDKGIFGIAVRTAGGAVLPSRYLRGPGWFAGGGTGSPGRCRGDGMRAGHRRAGVPHAWRLH